jgi:threonine/homoserine/homoserine lactone efflux protein
MVMAAASSGWHAVALVIVGYEIATLATMVALVTTARAGARALRAPWLDRYGDATAGALIVMMGTAMAVLGL